MENTSGACGRSPSRPGSHLGAGAEPGKRSCPGGRRPGRARESGVPVSGMGSFFGGLDFGGDDDWLVLLAENYNRTVTGQPQSAQRVLLGSPASLSLRTVG